MGKTYNTEHSAEASSSSLAWLPCPVLLSRKQQQEIQRSYKMEPTLGASSIFETKVTDQGQFTDIAPTV